MRLRITIGAGVAAAVVMLAGCTGGRAMPSYAVRTGGEAPRGRQVIREKNCGACHTIPGIHAARGLVGPSLAGFGQRTFIAGQLPNTPDNLVRWVRSPQSVNSATAMPNLGVTEQQARDVAAYLYSAR